MQYTVIVDHRKKDVSQTDSTLVVAFFHMAHLLKAGVGIGDTLAELAGAEKGRCRVWRQISSNVNQGQSLSEAIEALPRIFNPQLAALIKAGESSGELAAACHNCMNLLQWQQAVKSRLITVLIYPLFALTVLLCVVVFLLVYLVPAMSGFLVDSSADVTWHAQLLFNLSDWLLHYSWLMPVVVAGVAFAFVLSRRLSLKLRIITDSWLLKTPLVGRLIADLELSRYCNACAHLYGAGVSLSDSMRIAEGVLSNDALRYELSKSRKLMLSGVTLANALEKVASLPGVFRRVIAAGESTGALKHALLQASQYQQQQSDGTLERTEKLIAPVMLLLMGVVLLWIVTSLLGPVYHSAISTVVLS